LHLAVGVWGQFGGSTTALLVALVLVVLVLVVLEF